VPDRLLATVIGIVYPRAEPELKHLDEICGRGGVMIDVGAWYGPWSRRLARRADRLLALEPTSRARVLRQVLPPNAEVVCAAASDRAGTAELWTTGSGDGAEGLASIQRRGIHRGSLTVRLVRIDDLELTGVRFIKADVEGHELAVLRGAAETINRDRPRLLLEVEYRLQPVAPLLELLAGWSYEGWVLDAGRWIALTDFDLAERQAAAAGSGQRGLLRRLIWPHPRLVNSVLFVPSEQPSAD